MVDRMDAESGMVMYMMMSAQYLLVTDVSTKNLLLLFQRPLITFLYYSFISFTPGTGDK